MLTPARLPLALAMAATFGLAGCGSGGDDSPTGAPVVMGDDSSPSAVDDVSADASGEGDAVEGPGETVSGTADGNTMADGGADPGVGPFTGATRACGSIPVLDTPVATSPDAPASLIAGQLVRGRLDPDVEDNGTHYWRIDLQPGEHQLLLDARRIPGGGAVLELDINELDVAGEVARPLLQGREPDQRARMHAAFDNPEARTVTLEMRSDSAGQDYVLGVFADGQAVPSPFFEDCPDIRPLSLGTTEAVRVDGRESADDDYVWYGIDLPRGRYVFDGRASLVDGSDGPILYRVTTYDDFGQRSTAEEPVRIVGRGPVLSERVTFERDTGGPVWLRLDTSSADLDIDLQFTLTAEGG